MKHFLLTFMMVTSIAYGRTSTFIVKKGTEILRLKKKDMAPNFKDTLVQGDRVHYFSRPTEIEGKVYILNLPQSTLKDIKNALKINEKFCSNCELEISIDGPYFEVVTRETEKAGKIDFLLEGKDVEWSNHRR